ncbi:MAG: phosphate signaling complex protein PhoU [Candidatus Dormiibacterota bacterium]
MTDHGLLRLGGLVEGALTNALDALSGNDLALADGVVRGDLEINRARYQIEEQITDQLSGGDAGQVRWMVAALYVLSELERMGDHAEGIAKVTLMLGPHPTLSVPAVITEMGATTLKMVHRTLAAFEKRDARAARALCREDDEIDGLYDRAYQELISIMVADRKHVTEATYLIWITHNLERIADRATNICERVVYLVTGRVEELNVSKY